jgi:molybdopterin/thiamine biosynthesis adenylyltransferase
MPMSRTRIPLTDQDRATYEWQLWVTDFGETGQEALKGASVLISRCGGVGGTVAYYLAAAGIGRLVLAHGGNVRPSDLNRQLLMTHDSLGKPRIDSAARRLRELNPNVEIEAVPENVSEGNVRRLVERVDLVVDCAPLFTERFLMNREALRQGKPVVEAAMYDMEAQLTVFSRGAPRVCRVCIPLIRRPGSGSFLSLELLRGRSPVWRQSRRSSGSPALANCCLAACSSPTCATCHFEPFACEGILPALHAGPDRPTSKRTDAAKFLIPATAISD